VPIALEHTVGNISLQAVYQIPTEEDSPTECIALALQRVFYHLQTSNQPVGKQFVGSNEILSLTSLIPKGTTELTESFGWKAVDSSEQHDAQEFHRVLQDKLQSKMKVRPFAQKEQRFWE